MAFLEPGNPGRDIVQLVSPRKPRILLAATGSVAAITFGKLYHLFAEWADVQAVVTKASLRFIDPSSLPRNIAIYSDESEWRSWNKLGDAILHIELHKWADIMIIAPLSANTLGKIAGGLCDNLVTSIVRAWDYEKPIFVAPAMHTFMWENTLTEQHLVSIDDIGINLIPPVTKKLASGDLVKGAMAETSFINSTVRLWFESRVPKSPVTPSD